MTRAHALLAALVGVVDSSTWPRISRRLESIIVCMAAATPESRRAYLAAALAEEPWLRKQIGGAL